MGTSGNGLKSGEALSWELRGEKIPESSTKWEFLERLTKGSGVRIVFLQLSLFPRANLSEVRKIVAIDSALNSVVLVDSGTALSRRDLLS